MNNVIEFKEIKQDKELASNINWIGRATHHTCVVVAQRQMMTLAVLDRVVHEYLEGKTGKEDDPVQFIIYLHELLAGFNHELKEELEG